MPLSRIFCVFRVAQQRVEVGAKGRGQGVGVRIHRRKRQQKMLEIYLTNKIFPKKIWVSTMVLQRKYAVQKTSITVLPTARVFQPQVQNPGKITIALDIKDFNKF